MGTEVGKCGAIIGIFAAVGCHLSELESPLTKGTPLNQEIIASERNTRKGPHVEHQNTCGASIHGFR